MCKIANIITTDYFENNQLYNVVKNIDSIIPNIPTLIIGWDLAKSLFPDASILEWKINDSFYWTFAKRKRRNRFENDILKFKEIAIDTILKKVNYQFMDVLTMENIEKKDFFSLLKDDSSKISILKDDMIFILYLKTNTIYGISLKDIDYKGNNRKIFLKQLYSNKSIKIIDNITLPYDIMQKIKDNLYILPCFFI